MKLSSVPFVCLLAFAGAAFGAPQPPPPPAATSDASAQAAPVPPPDYPRVVLETNKGKIELELYSDKAPKTVDNFLQYVRSGFYNNTIFQRVISGFMIQTGGFSTDGKQKPTREPILNEADNRIHNDRGTIAMARTNDPHSASAQFFINLKDNGFLNHTGKNPAGWGYCVFGRVVEGMDAVDAIAAVPVNKPGQLSESQPVEPVIIVKATVSHTPKGMEPAKVKAKPKAKSKPAPKKKTP
jgi:peptidyl-prolyl cis-trans isomerase B (cyclophilin B)